MTNFDQFILNERKTSNLVALSNLTTSKRSVSKHVAWLLDPKKGRPMADVQKIRLVRGLCEIRGVVVIGGDMVTIGENGFYVFEDGYDLQRFYNDHYFISCILNDRVSII